MLKKKEEKDMKIHRDGLTLRVVWIMYLLDKKLENIRNLTSLIVRFLIELKVLDITNGVKQVYYQKGSLLT